MDVSENSALLSRSRKGILQNEHKKNEESHTDISTYDVSIRNVNIILVALAVSLGSVSKAQYIYKWVSLNTILPDIILGSNATSSGNTPQQCAKNSSSDAENEYQRLAARFSLYFTLTEKGIALPVLAFFGIYSDLIGRKPLMIAGILVEAIKYGLISFLIYKDFHITYLFISYAICGLGGTYFSFYLGTLAAIADTTARGKQRSFSIALLDAVIGLSALVGQITAGYVIHITGFVYINMIVAGLFILILLSIIFLYKETRQNRQGTNSFKPRMSWNICDAIKRITGFYTHKEQRRNMPLSIFLTTAVVFLCVYSAFSPRSDIEILYSLNFPFCWSSVKIGYYRAVKDFVQMFIGVMVIKLLHVCTTDEIICIIRCISGIASLVLMAFASNDWMMYLATALGVMCIVPIPLIRGIFSKAVLSDKQGALFANIYIFEILCSLGGSSIFNNIYAETQSIMKGLVFLVMAGFYLLSVFLLIICSCMTSTLGSTPLFIQGDTGPSMNSRGSDTPCPDTVDLMNSKAPVITNNDGSNTEEVDSV
ncbi:solute carrier family 46 member 3-like [Mizuhopecten yessoensis]|uniref:solute carrier family 46 member 3-like n=1 Tax=Mizuhopecten yessoensis TaxID=6573 RepID=UPI000B45C521|nr:solute carrier family 46 member 3-like [Mizuhopecten yessoensis]